MIDTDFDLLCDGVNPAEAKRLRKILAEWCGGDENSFPVQLALLTKAQWRAIGRLPHILRDSQKDWQQDQASHRARFSEQFNSALDDARRLASDSKKLLDAVQAEHRRQIAAQSKTTVEAIDGRLKQYDMTVSGYNDVIHGIATQICSKARELEAVARKIQDDLNEGTDSWNKAKENFNVAREQMDEERKRLTVRLERLIIAIKKLWKNCFPEWSLSDFTDSTGLKPIKFLLIKRNAFQHEREVRLAYIHPESRNNTHGNIKSFDIDPNALFDRLLFDPRINDTDFDGLKEVDPKN